MKRKLINIDLEPCYQCNSYNTDLLGYNQCDLIKTDDTSLIESCPCRSCLLKSVCEQACNDFHKVYRDNCFAYNNLMHNTPKKKRMNVNN